MIPRFISKSFIPTGEPAGSPSPSPTPPAASVPGQLVPDFVSENSSQYAPQIVQFNDTSGGDPSGWLWNFGDGSASSLKDPVHVYQNPGNYTVVLTVYNATADRSVIRENAAIVLERQSQTADPTRVFPITPQIEDNGNGTYTAYFGYNNENTIAVSIPPGPLNGFSPSPANRGQPTVFEPGIHTDAISMVFDGNDLTWTINNQKATASRFSPKRSEPPVADFSGYPVTGTAPLRVIFSDSSRGSPESWEWLFGDGSSSNEQDPEHTYLRPGNYTVTLTVKNLFGIHRATKTDYISIVSQPTGTGQPA
jgi:PKD repeat protein